ncbi:hypothetical protein KC887_02295 [Candidatus Kaiserbacteria bacterium]|nr:hypothetical protein [Candidatus Kaiserbacteria bacterium]
MSKKDPKVLEEHPFLALTICTIGVGLLVGWLDRKAEEKRPYFGSRIDLTDYPKNL